MKRCTICKHPKPRSAFNANPAKSDRLQTMCRDCGKAASKAYYRKNRKKHKALVKERRQRLRREVQERLRVILSALKCADCPETDIVVFEFDHVRGKKVADVSKLVTNGAPWSVVEAEMKKCDVVCANCHRKRTARRNGSWRLTTGFNPQREHCNKRGRRQVR